MAGRWVKRPAALMGDAVISDALLGPFVSVRVLGGSLDVTLRCDDHQLSTQDGTGYIRFAKRLPDTVVAACAGRSVSDVVSHPLLRSRGYVVKHAAQVGSSSSLTFDVGRLGVELP